MCIIKFCLSEITHDWSNQESLSKIIEPTVGYIVPSSLLALDGLTCVYYKVSVCQESSHDWTNQESLSNPQLCTLSLPHY